MEAIFLRSLLELIQNNGTAHVSTRQGALTSAGGAEGQSGLKLVLGLSFRGAALPREEPGFSRQKENPLPVKLTE